MNWLEVSLTLDGEIAEAVAEVLARFAPNGVVIESTAIESTPDDEGMPVGPLHQRQRRRTADRARRPSDQDGRLLKHTDPSFAIPR